MLLILMEVVMAVNVDASPMEKEMAALIMEQIEIAATNAAKIEVARMCADESFDGFDKHYTEDQAKYDAYHAARDKMEWEFAHKAMMEALDGLMGNAHHRPSECLRLAIAIKIASTHLVKP